MRFRYYVESQKCHSHLWPEAKRAKLAVLSVWVGWHTPASSRGTLANCGCLRAKVRGRGQTDLFPQCVLHFPGTQNEQFIKSNLDLKKKQKKTLKQFTLFLNFI